MNPRSHGLIEGSGEFKTLAEWAASPICRVALGELAARIDAGWPMDLALSLPSGTKLRLDPTQTLVGTEPDEPEFRKAG